MCSDSGGNGQSSNQVIECFRCVCGLAVCNIIIACIGLIVSMVSESAFMNLCMGSAYGGGYMNYGGRYVGDDTRACFARSGSCDALPSWP